MKCGAHRITNIKELKRDLNFEYINKWNAENTEWRILKDCKEIWILNAWINETQSTQNDEY